MTVPACGDQNKDRDEPHRDHAAAKRVRPTITRELSDLGLKLGDPVFIRIFKEERELELWVKQPRKKTFKLFRTYRIAAMSGWR